MKVADVRFWWSSKCEWVNIARQSHVRMFDQSRARESDLTFQAWRSPGQESSGLHILLKITLESILNSQNICRRVVGWILIKIYPSNISWKFHLLERYRQNSQVILGTTGTNGLKSAIIDFFDCN